MQQILDKNIKQIKDNKVNELRNLIKKAIENCNMIDQIITNLNN